MKEYGVGAQILLDLGVKDMILLTDTPEKKVVALDGYGLNIVGTHPHPRKATNHDAEHPDRRGAVLRPYRRSVARWRNGGAGSRRARISSASRFRARLEIPAAIVFAAKAGEGAGKSYDGYVALGCVIRGETYHFEIVVERIRARIDGSGLHHGLCIGNGILTVENEEQALARASRDGQDKGGDAARACLALISIRAKLGAHR